MADQVGLEMQDIQPIQNVEVVAGEHHQPQQMNQDGWYHRIALLDRQPQTEAIKFRRICWIVVAIISAFGFIFAAELYHLKFPRDDWFRNAVIFMIAVGVILFFSLFLDPIVVVPEFKFRHKTVQVIGKASCDFLGVFGCSYILSSISNHTRGVCWMYVAGSGFTLALFKFISPTFDFSVPSMLAQIAMNESLMKKNEGGILLTVGVGAVCFLIFCVQGNLDISWEWWRSRFVHDGDVVVVPMEEGWTPMLIIFDSRAQCNTLRFRRLCWLFISFLPIPIYGVGYMYHTSDHKSLDHPKSPNHILNWLVMVLMLVFSLVLMFLTVYECLREIKFKHKGVHTAAKIFFDFGGVIACFEILDNIGTHTPGLCWVYVSLSIYTLTAFKVISPSFDFSIPSLLAQIAMNEAIHQDNKSKLLTGEVAGVCSLIFIVQAFLDIHWERFRNIFQGANRRTVLQGEGGDVNGGVGGGSGGRGRGHGPGGGGRGCGIGGRGPGGNEGVGVPGGNDGGGGPVALGHGVGVVV